MSEKLEYAQLVTAQSIAQQTLFQEKMLERQRVLEALRAPPAPAHARGRFQRVHFTRSDMQTMADKQLKLCPIRLDLDFDGYKLRDTLVWNLHDRVVDPTDFAKTTCLDLGLPTGFVPLISTSIREQLEDHFQHAPACLDPKSDPQGNGGIDNTIDLPELRILIKLDITIDHNTILDRFEWDLACPRNNPERFAEQMVRELGLVDEFKTAISHAIREQVHVAAKSLLLAAHDFSSSTILDHDLSKLFLPCIDAYNIKRGAKEQLEFQPLINYASASEIERMERDHDREIRRKRRQTQRSRRITTNEPEQFKTNRTPIPKPKSKVEPDEEHATGSGSDEYSEEEVVRVSKRTRDL